MKTIMLLIGVVILAMVLMNMNGDQVVWFIAKLFVKAITGTSEF